MDPRRFYSGFALLTASLAVHGSVLFSMDRAMSFHQVYLVQEQRKVQKEKEGPLQFEFVETPRTILSKRPERAKKISDRHALNRDLLKEKPQIAERPHAELQGHADQLAQKQGSAAQVPSPKVDPLEAVWPHEKEAVIANVGDSRDEARLPDGQAISSSSATLGLPDQQAGVEIATPHPPKNAADHARNDTMKDPEPARPRVEPKPEILGTGGVDKITTQEMSKIKSPGARLFGQTSFEATGSGMGEYMKNLKEKIWLAWFPYLAYRYPQDFRGADVVVNMILDAQGRVKTVRVIDSVGSEVFASYCVEAIQRASSFGPVPKEILALIGKEELELKFGFHYR